MLRETPARLAMSTIVAFCSPCLPKQAYADSTMSSRVSVAWVERGSLRHRRSPPYRSGARISPLVGTPVPDVTSTCSTLST